MFSGNTNGILKESPNNLKVIEAARCPSANNRDIVIFIKLVYLTSYLESIAENCEADNNVRKKFFEQICIGKLDLLKQIFNAKDEMARVITSDVDIIASGFRLIYQTTVEDDLDRFDIHYDNNNDISNNETMEIGLRLMEKGNMMRSQYKGQYKTFETSTKKRIVIYFPRSDDNITESKYSYPRAAIHTALQLSKKMFENRMSSALGLSIGWGALIQEVHMKQFSDFFTTDETILPGITKFLKKDQSIMCLVTVPRVRPHKYLKLTNFEGLIFLIFSIINDIVITMSKGSQELIANFTSDTTSKLTNLILMLDNINVHNKAIVYACKVCVLNIKRKGVAPAYIMKIMNDLLAISKKTINNPEEKKENDIFSTEEDHQEDITSLKTTPICILSTSKGRRG